LQNKSELTPLTEPHLDDWADLQRRSRSHRRWFYGRQPKPVAEVIAQLVQKRGYAQVRSAGEWNDAWRAAAGEAFAAVTEVGQLRRGVLEVTAANSLVMQELGFEKERILQELQIARPDANLKQLRFRVGNLG
jgi:predicted nucleic acid-binding Zn ribbon protein